MWNSELIGSTLTNFPVLCQYPLYPEALDSYFGPQTNSTSREFQAQYVHRMILFQMRSMV